jgi:hypothetical protein
MLVLATAAIALGTALVFTVLFFLVVVGIHQAHPTDLGLPGSTFLAAMTGRVLGLYVRRGEPPEPALLADPSAERDPVTR